MEVFPGFSADYVLLFLSMASICACADHSGSFSHVNVIAMSFLSLDVSLQDVRWQRVHYFKQALENLENSTYTFLGKAY